MSFLNLFAEVNVPVVGGHAGITILPLFSQVILLPLTSIEYRIVFLPQNLVCCFLLDGGSLTLGCLFDRPHQKPIYQMKISKLLQRGLKMEGRKLWKQRLERDLQHCQWRKYGLKSIQCAFFLGRLILWFVA